ncbi:recombination-associated protein RdgC [Vibrio parahaemolyticus]|nr:recombination-associated protein RdgC [Vibrio parahaemolyticus]
MSIFPKNAMVYRHNLGFSFDLEKLEEQMKEFAYTPCGETDKQKFGWTPALGKNTENFVHIADQYALIVAKKEVKDLPASVINESLKEKVEAIEKAEGRPMKKREKDALKDDLMIDLLPRAFSKYSHFSVFINTKTNLVVVDASSFKAAEDVLALLRKTIGSLPVVPAVPVKAIESTMTEWVKNNTVPSGFTLKHDIKLKSVLEEGGIAAFKKQEIGSDEIKACIEANKVVTSLKMDWQERIEFTLADSGTIKSLKFSDQLQDQNDDIPREDVLARLDADFCLAAGNVFEFLKSLYTELGGFNGEDHLYTKDETAEPNTEALPDTVTFSHKIAEKLMLVIDSHLDEPENSDELDGLFILSRDHVAETRRASVSNLQRKFKIGYNRAARIMEQLEACGVVSKPAHNGHRSVLIAPKEAE